MIPAGFDYFAPKTLDEALRLVERHGDEAKILAGGQSLLPLMKLRLAAPRFIVDLGRLRGMSYIREENGQIVIGAMTTHADVAASELLRARCPLLAETAEAIGDVQVRNRGTLGGSLAHADPAADYPAAILALDAQMMAASSMGARTIPAKGFFVDMLTTQLRPGEILSQVRAPILPPRAGTAYAKLHQVASGFAIVGAAVYLQCGKNNRIENIAIGLTGVGPKAYRAEAVEQVLLGKQPTTRLVADASRLATNGIEALADLHAPAEYRREMAAVFTRRAIERALGRAARWPA